MKDDTVILISIIGFLLSIPFLISIIINPNGFGKREIISLIVLGMVVIGLPLTCWGVWKIIYRLPESESKT